MDPRLFKIQLADGSESPPFDGDALISYTRSGNIHPQSRIFDVLNNQWTTAGNIDILYGQWPAASGGFVSPSYPYGQQSQQKGPSATAMVIGVVIFFIIGLLGAMVVPVVKRLLVPGTPQTVSTRDGLYAVTVPSTMLPLPNKRPTVVEYANWNHSSIFTMARSADSPQTIYDLRNLMSNFGWRLNHNSNGQPLSPERQCTIGIYPALQGDFFEDTPQGHRFDFRITFISTPDATYHFIETWPDGDDGKRAPLDSILTTFHKNVSVPRGTVQPMAHDAS